MKRSVKGLTVTLELLGDALIFMDRGDSGPKEKRLFRGISPKAEEPVFFNFHDLYPLWFVALGRLPQ